MTFAEAGFLPAAIVHLGTESLRWPLLSEECLGHAQSAWRAEVVQAEARERQSFATKPAVSESTGRSDPRKRKTVAASAAEPRQSAPADSTSRSTTGKVPKWFKTGK